MYHEDQNLTFKPEEYAKNMIDFSSSSRKRPKNKTRTQRGNKYLLPSSSSGKRWYNHDKGPKTATIIGSPVKHAQTSDDRYDKVGLVSEIIQNAMLDEYRNLPLLSKLRGNDYNESLRCPYDYPYWGAQNFEGTLEDEIHKGALHDRFIVRDNKGKLDWMSVTPRMRAQDTIAHIAKKNYKRRKNKQIDNLLSAKTGLDIPEAINLINSFRFGKKTKPKPKPKSKAKPKSKVKPKTKAKPKSKAKPKVKKTKKIT